GAAMQIDLAVEAGSENVLAEITGLACILDRPFHHREQVIELAANVDVRGLRSDRIAADETPLDQQVRVALHQQVILEGTRLALVSMADDELGLRRFLVDELPFESRREAGPAAATKTRLLHVVDDSLRRHRERLLQSLIALLVLEIVVEREAV